MNSQVLEPIALQSQGKSPFLFVAAVVAAVILGAILGAVGRSLGVPEKVTYTFPLVLGLPTIAFSVWYSVAPQGWLRLDAERLTVEPRMRGAQVWRRGTSQPTLRAWLARSGSAVGPGGPLLEFSGTGGDFTVGSLDPELGHQLPGPERSTLPLAPDFVVSRSDFVDLAEALAIPLPRRDTPNP